MKSICLFVTMFMVLSTQALALIPEDLAARALVGEAGGQSDEEIRAHAFALRNRGTLRGVYGVSAPHLKREPKASFERALRFWRQATAGGIDPVGGRTEWRSEYDLKLMKKRGHTIRSHGLTDGIKIGETTFYFLLQAPRPSLTKPGSRSSKPEKGNSAIAPGPPDRRGCLEPISDIPVIL